jgi:mannose/cellobiose epimerase-like protein (N-acyl-D-glucosamine 2-epimerase family)
LGWEPGADLSRLGYEYLVEKARLPDGGWARVLSRAGAVTDARPDLYDLAFVLLAMAWRYRVSADSESLRHAHATLDFIQQEMRAPEGGFWERLPREGPRLQNPHMHLAEACIAAFEATEDERFLAQAEELVDLLLQRFFDGRTLGERFDSCWSRISGDGGRALEPGHHFEWSWILTRYQLLSGRVLSHEAQALAAFAETHGVHASSGLVLDAMRDDGLPLRRSSRAWTNTERIKAWLGIYELTDRDPRREVAESLNVLFGRYFRASRAGLWIDQFNLDGAPMVSTVPTSIVYHLFSAFAEVLRLEPCLVARD